MFAHARNVTPRQSPRLVRMRMRGFFDLLDAFSRLLDSRYKI